ncbi:MAG TPA: type II secretion system protein [Tepidisphaeraceae bacterium]|jgi:type II secretory pathway pseudopilin PulG|nr:type II secretion system protein [Tepidisphaeraceae bacterium]
MDKRIPHPRLTRTRGFTLIEAALTTVIVGVAFVAMLTLFAAGTSVNNTSASMTTGMHLAKSVREMAMTMEFTSPASPGTWGRDSGETATNPGAWDDLNDLDNASFSPPIDGGGNVIPNMENWRQTIDVRCVDVNGMETLLPDGTSEAIRITTIVTRGTDEVCRLSWYAFEGTP